MTVDVAARFPRTTAWDGYVQGRDTERWVFDEVICSSLTMIYGRSNVGKSYVVSSMLLALLIDGREFLGMQPTDKGKLWKPAILWTDPDSPWEYGERLYLKGGLPESVEVPMFHLGRTSRPEEWDALTELVLSEGFNFVVLDNLMGATGDTNDALSLTTVFDGLTKLTNRGITVVVVHHESEHGYSSPGSKPLGLSISTQKARTWVQIRKTNRRGLRGGNTAMIVEGNGLGQAQEIVAEPLAGPFYRVLKRGPWGEAPEDKQQRSKERLDSNDALLAWLNTYCPSVPYRDGIQLLADHLGMKYGSAQSRVSRAGLSKSGDGWVRKAATGSVA